MVKIWFTGRVVVAVVAHILLIQQFDLYRVECMNHHYCDLLGLSFFFIIILGRLQLRKWILSALMISSVPGYKL